MRFFWLTVLSIFLMGCSIYQPVGGTRRDPTDPEHDIDDILEKGDLVRLTLADEEELEGQVLTRSGNEVILEVAGEPPSQRRLPVRQIMVIEKAAQVPSTEQIVIMVMGAAVVAGFVVGANAVDDAMELQ